MSESLDGLSQEEIDRLVGADEPDSDGYTWKQGDEDE